jgi:hypothetical protein
MSGPGRARAAISRTAPDGLTERRPLLDLVADWAAFLADDDLEATYQRLRTGERTGRPLGERALIDRLETALGRRQARQQTVRRDGYRVPLTSAPPGSARP